MRRVAVTGIGVVSPVGSGRETFWRRLVAGVSGTSVVTLFDTSAMPVRIGGQVRDLDMPAVTKRFPAAAVERDRKVPLGLAAAAEAIDDAALTAADLRSAVFYAGVGLEAFCLDDITPFAREANMGSALARAVLAAGAAAPIVQTPLDRLGELVCRHYGIRGGRYTNGSACAAGAQAVGESMRLIQDGECDLAIAGATDSMLNPLGLGGFSLLRVLSAENDHPERACRPFDAARQGTVLGEGAAFLVLECADRAAARGAHVWAELIGYGSSMDAFAVSDPEPTGLGAMLSMRKALADAGLAAGEVDCVSAHGTGTIKNDIVETAAIKAVLGPRAYQVPVHSVKSMTGHMIAASGAVEAAAAVLTLARRTVPPTINLDRPDADCDLDYVPGRARAFDGRTVLSNSFGFGGQNATLIFRRCH
jgi:3-oxoacyl-[acyl-carrier-protein] synthase II